MESKTLPVPRRHHFVPRAYFRAWAKGGTGELVYAYSRDPKGRLRESSSCSTRSIGHVSDLYSFRPDGLTGRRTFTGRARLEVELFGPIDQQAARVLQALRRPSVG